MQTERVLDAATRLFQTRGYRATDLGDIASAVGLARNSLYRYYPSKDHILLACVQRDMQPALAEIRSLEAAFPDPRERIGAWLDTQIEIAMSPAHATMQLMSEIREAAPELRREIMALHGLASATLEAALTECLRGTRRDASLVAAMITGMTGAAAGQAIRTNRKASIKRELRAAVDRVIQSQ